jgi:hypothetical protein
MAARNVAALLAVAAVLAALITARASFLTSDASGGWQRALRTEVQRSAGALEDVRYLYQSELPLAMTVETARSRSKAAQDAAATATGAVRTRLLFEAAVYDKTATSLEPASELSTDPAYTLPDGGYDLAKRLSDLRNRAPELLALDPDGLVAGGDILADKARRITLSTFPISLGVLAGALAQPFARWRRLLVALGSVAVGLGALMWLVMEVVP